MARSDTITGGRAATDAVVPGLAALSIGLPSMLPEPDGYRWTSLSAVARLESGHTPSRAKPEFWDGDIPWIGIRDATGNHGKVIANTEQHVTQLGIDNSSARVLPANTVCLSRTASVGYVVQTARPMATSQDFVNWVCGPDLNPNFLRYLLMSESDSIRRFAYGSVHATMYYPDAKALHVLLPARKEQDAIAEVLGALDDKIAANTALAETAEATITFAYALASRDGVADKPLLDELTIEFGEPFGGAHFSKPRDGRPLIRIRDLRTFKSQVWSTEWRPKEVVVAPGDVLVGMDAEFRATPWLGEAGLLNQRVLRARHTTFGRALVREMLRRPLAEVEGEKSATTVIHLNKADLARKRVGVPHPDALAAFERLAEPLYETRVALAVENRTLAATRDALLPQLMSGTLRVRDAEAAAS